MVELGTTEITVIEDTMVMRSSPKNHVIIFFAMRERNLEQNILNHIFILIFCYIYFDVSSPSATSLLCIESI